MSHKLGIPLKPNTPRIPRPFFTYFEKKKLLPDQTERFLRILARPIIPDSIDFLSIVIIGSMGFGKTKLVEWVCTQIVNHYGADRVNAIRNRGAELKALMENMDSKPVQVLFLDDSFGKMKPDIAKEFTLVRHKFGDVLEAAGKPRSGVIIAMFGIQDLFTLDKLARRVGSCIIAKSSSADKYYRTELKKNFGAAGLEELDRITDQVMTHYSQKIKGTSVITIIGAGETGVLFSELVDIDPFTDVETQINVKYPSLGTEMLADRVVTWDSEPVINDPSLLKLIVEKIPEALKDINVKKYVPKHSP